MLQQILQQIPDKRRAQGRIYSIDTILLIVIISIISGSKSYREVAIFTRIHFKIFKKYLKLKWRKSPSYSTIRNIIVSLETDDLESKFRDHAQQVHESEVNEHVCIDGKTVRGSFDKYNSKEAMQVLSVFFTGDLIVAGHKFFRKDKTNEIPKLRELIRELKLEDKLVTADALHCQKNTISQLKAQECECVIQVKDNQPKLLVACQEICNSYNPFDRYRQRDVGHTRFENRYINVYSNPAVLTRYIPKLWREQIYAVVEVRRNTTHFEPKGKSSKYASEISYYISTFIDKASVLGKVTRNHWLIENKLNYVKDVSMGEDDSRIRVKVENFIILRDWALNILRRNMSKTLFVKSQLFQNSLCIDRVMKFKGLFT